MTDEIRDRRPGRDAGHAMAGLLVAIAVMGIMMAAAMPVWKTWAQREKEAELIFRGGQYARAIRLYGARFPNAYPPDIETLVEGRFLRKAYPDPMSRNDPFELVRLDSLQTVPGMAAGANPGDAEEDGRSNDSSGPIVGVRSRSTEAALRQLNGLTTYREWVFTPTAVGELGGYSSPAASAVDTGATDDVGGEDLVETGGDRPLGR